MSLSIIKNSFFNNDNFQLRNRFSVWMSLKDPKLNEFRVMSGEPALSVALSSMTSIGAPFQFQNIPLTIPTKFQGGNNAGGLQLQITFYLRESLNVFNQLNSLIKQYGGDPIFSGDLNRPTSFFGSLSNFDRSTLYNSAIRQNRAKIYLFDEVNTSTTNRYIEFFSIYPSSIIPINLDSSAETAPTQLTVNFNYAYAQSWNETELGGPFGSG
tara:strand:- start:9 stop:644 length:636 start_codon:yes stop_codon:yes gene_type:complete